MTGQEAMKKASELFLQDNKDYVLSSDMDMDNLVAESFTFYTEEFYDTMLEENKPLFDTSEEVKYQYSGSCVYFEGRDDEEWTIALLTDDHWLDEDNYNPEPKIILVSISKEEDNDMVEKASYTLDKLV